MITRNSAKCDTCEVEIESQGRHHFNVHYCPKNPKRAMMWQGDKLVPSDPPTTTWNFAVDGGRDYLRRCGDGYTDTSVGVEDEL